MNSDVMESVARDPIALVLMGLGITFSPYEYFGGLFMAFAGAALAFHFSEQRERPASKTAKTRFWAVYLAAFFVSTLAAMGWTAWYPEAGFSKQFVMALAGFGSRFLIRGAADGLGIWQEGAGRKIAREIDRRTGLDANDEEDKP